MAAPSNSPRRLPPQKLLLAILDYNPVTGVLVWRERHPEMFGGDTIRCRQFNTRRAGKEALCSRDRCGYKRGALFGQFVYSHRIVWKMVHGEDPPGQIDHINGAVDDNRIENLRSVDDAENRKNQALPVDNKSGRIGVHWWGTAGCWKAEISVDRQRKHLGIFASFEDAVAAREAAEARFGFHPNHGRNPAMKGS